MHAGVSRSGLALSGVTARALRACVRTLLLAAMALWLLAGCRATRARLHRARASRARPPREFVVTEAQLDGFTRWRRFDEGALSIGGHPSGRRWVFASRGPLRASEREFPVGTIVVHATGPGARPSRWELFAMVKRGANFNADGARGWEYLLLQSNDDAQVTVLARGTNPRSGHESTYAATDVGPRGCNACHGTLDTRETDGMLSNAMRGDR